MVAGANTSPVGTPISQKGRSVLTLIVLGLGLIHANHREALLFQDKGTVRRHVQIDKVDGLHVEQGADGLSLLSMRSAEPTTEGIGSLLVDEYVSRLDAADGMSKGQPPRQQTLAVLGRLDGEAMALEARGREGNEPTGGGRRNSR